MIVTNLDGFASLVADPPDANSTIDTDKHLFSDIDYVC